MGLNELSPVGKFKKNTFSYKYVNNGGFNTKQHSMMLLLEVNVFYFVPAKTSDEDV